MSLTGLKDVDREVLKHVDDKELLEICTINRKTWNEVCDDAFLKRRLTSKYPGIEKFKKANESWKRFFLTAIYYISKMKDEFDFDYSFGDLWKQYSILKQVEKWAEVFKTPYDFDSLLIRATEVGDVALAEFSLRKGANIQHGDGALRSASQNGHLNIVKYLLKQGADIHAGEDSALRSASRNGRLDIVKYLVQSGANIHARNDGALQEAIAYGQLAVFKYLMNQGANIHAIHEYGLKLARRNKRFEVVKYLESLRGK